MDVKWSSNSGSDSSNVSVTEPGDYTVTVSGPTDFDCINVSSIQTIEVSGSPDAYNASVTTQCICRFTSSCSGSNI